MTTLDKLAPGESATIAKVDVKGGAGRRILEMGLSPGTTVKMVRKAPLNDPVEFTVRGYNISLRSAEAATIHVETGGSQ